MNPKEKAKRTSKDTEEYSRERYTSDIRSILEGDAGVSLRESILLPIGAFDQEVTEALHNRSMNPAVPKILETLKDASKSGETVPSIEIVDMLRRYVIAGHLSHDSDPKHGALAKIKKRMNNATDKTVTFLYDLIHGLHNTLESANSTGESIKIDAAWLAEQICSEIMSQIPKTKKHKVHRLIVLDVLLHNKKVQRLFEIS